VTTIDARANTEWDQLIAMLSKAAQLHIVSNDDGRLAAIFQLSAILKFFEADTQAKRLTTPLRILLSALTDLHKGGKPAKILTSQKPGHRQRDDVALRTVKIVAAVIMDQLQEYAGLKRGNAASKVAKVFSEFGLSNFRGKHISAVTITKWRDQAKAAKEDSALGRQYKQILAFDAKALAQDAPPERKRDFLLKRRLPLLLIQFGEAQGLKALEARQRLIEELIPKNPAS